MAFKSYRVRSGTISSAILRNSRPSSTQTNLGVPVLVLVQELPDGQLIILVPGLSTPLGRDVLEVVDDRLDKVVGQLAGGPDLVKSHRSDLLPIRDRQGGDLIGGVGVLVVPREDERGGGGRRTQKGGEWGE